MRPDELGAIERHNGHGEEIRCEDRQRHAQRQWREDVLAHAAEKCDREKDDGGGERRGQHRHGNLCAPFGGGNLRRFAQLHMPEDVFQHNNAVIDQPREDQRQSA